MAIEGGSVGDQDIVHAVAVEIENSNAVTRGFEDEVFSGGAAVYVRGAQSRVRRNIHIADSGSCGCKENNKADAACHQERCFPEHCPIVPFAHGRNTPLEMW